MVSPRDDMIIVYQDVAVSKGREHEAVSVI